MTGEYALVFEKLREAIETETAHLLVPNTDEGEVEEMQAIDEIRRVAEALVETRALDVHQHLRAVGSRAGAVLRRRGLSVSPRFLWECLTSRTVSPFPAPATSHAACGFPALRAPAHFPRRVM